MKKDLITYHPERNCTSNAKSSAKLRPRQVLIPQTVHVALSNEDPTIEQNPAAKDVASEFRGLQSGR